MSTPKNFRHGHRERVRDRFLRDGLVAFADYEVLELLLFYAIPRMDTKRQAHALDDTFGSLHGTLTADADSLCRVSGIGARTASFLRSLYPFLRYVAKEEPHNDAYLDNDSLARLIFPRIDRTVTESALLVFMNNCDEIVCVEPIGQGKCYAQLKMDALATSAYAYRAASVVLVDYKKVGIPFPDSVLPEAVQHLKTELSTLGITLRDYLLFTDTQYSSLFSLTGNHAFEFPSPFFVDADALARLPYEEKSEKHFSEILSLVTKEEKAKAIAQRLLRKFGSLATVLSLPYETLLAENTDAAMECLYLKILSETYSRAEYSRIRAERAVYTSAEEVGRMFSNAIGMNSEETVALATFDKDMRLINLTICAKGSVNTASFTTRTLIETAISQRARYVAVAHNHPNGLPHPSVPDTAMTLDLYRAFHQAKIAYLDHFVVSRTSFVPVSRTGYESYTDMPPSFFSSTI